MPKRIIFISTGIKCHGGAEVQLRRVATGLRKNKGHQIAVISFLKTTPVMEEEFKRHSIHVESLGLEKGQIKILAFWKLIKFLWSWKPDVIISFQYAANIIARLSRLFYRTKLVVTSIRGEFFGSELRNKIFKLTNFLSHHDVTNSKITYHRLLDQKILNKKQSSYIHNGIIIQSPQLHSTDIRESLEVTPNEFMWLAVGRFVQQKDYPTLIQAFAILEKRVPCSKLYIAGGGQPDAEIQKLIYKYDLSQKVTFLGRRSDINNLLVSADAFVQSSKLEGLPNTIMEAMLCSKIIVATNAGGSEELISHGKNGYISDVGDIDSLAENMYLAYNLNTSDKQKMQSQAFLRLKENFDINTIVDKWHSLIMD